MCADVHACMRACVHARNACTYARIFACTNARMHICTHAHLHACTPAHRASAHTCMHASRLHAWYTNIYTFTHARTQDVQTCTCTRTRMHTHACNRAQMHACTRTRAYTYAPILAHTLALAHVCTMSEQVLIEDPVCYRICLLFRCPVFPWLHHYTHA